MFDLVSIDVLLGTATTFTADNGSSVIVPGIVGTFSFPSGWTGITSVVWDADSPIFNGYMGIDNLVFNPTHATSVPEPASLLLLGSGLLGMAAVGKRRGGRQRKDSLPEPDVLMLKT